MNELQQNSGFGLSVKHIIWAIGRRKGAIAVSTLLGLVMAQLFIMFVPPKYVASSQLLFDAAVERIVSSDQELRSSYGVHQVFGSAAAMIELPGILKPVAIKIMSHSAGQLSSEPWIQKILANPDLSDGERMSLLIDRLQKNLIVKTQAADQVIVLEYKSNSPSEAAYIANLIAATFIEQRAASRKASLSQATEWLDERSSEAKDRLIAVDKKIQDFKAKHLIEDLTGPSVLEAELMRARDQLSAVQTQLTELQTVYETLHAYATGNAGGYERLAENIGGAALERLRSSLADAQGALASAKSRLGEFHPDVKAREGQVAAIRAEIGAEARRKLLTSKVEIERLTSRQKALQEEVKNLEGKVQTLRASEVQLRELQREREAIKTLYNSILAKVMQANIQQTLNFAQFKILLDATVPNRPKLPPALFWSAGLLAGLGFGIFASLLLEVMRGRLVMADQIKSLLPDTIVIQVPIITKKDFPSISTRRQSNYQRFAKDFPKSLFTNKLLSVQLAVDAIDTDGEGKIVMITSPMQGNGKTHMSLNLAGLSVLSLANTLLIDLDVRKNSQSYGVLCEPIRSELGSFLKENDLEEAFTLTRGPEGYDILRVRASNEAACLRFFQTKTVELLNFVRQNYRYVWIDTPPVGIFNDPLIIARQVDGIMIVAEWSKTTTRQLKDTINLISESGGHVLGIIMNKVQVNKLISESMVSYANYYGDIKHGGRSPEL